MTPTPARARPGAGREGAVRFVRHRLRGRDVVLPRRRAVVEPAGDDRRARARDAVVAKAAVEEQHLAARFPSTTTTAAASAGSQSKDSRFEMRSDGYPSAVRATWRARRTVRPPTSEVRRRSRLEELESGTATAEDAARRLAARSSRSSRRSSSTATGEPVVALVPGDQRAVSTRSPLPFGAAKDKIARPAEVEQATGFAPAPSRFPAPERRSRADRAGLLSHDVVWVGAGLETHLAALHPGALVRLARRSRSSRPGPRIPFRPRGHLHARDRNDLDERRVHRLARREGARRRARAPLRQGRLRGHPLLQDPRGPAVFRLREHVERLDNSAKLLHMELPFSSTRSGPRCTS